MQSSGGFAQKFFSVDEFIAPNLFKALWIIIFVLHFLGAVIFLISALISSPMYGILMFVPILLLTILSLLFSRVAIEAFIVIFSIHDVIVDIRNLKRQDQVQ